MSLEPQNAGRDPGTPPSGDAWGWALVQRDWSLRQSEPVRPRGITLASVRARFAVLGRIAGGLVGGLARALRALLRLISRPAGGGPGTPRSSARPSSSRGC